MHLSATFYKKLVLTFSVTTAHYRRGWQTYTNTNYKDVLHPQTKYNSIWTGLYSEAVQTKKPKG